MAMTPDDPVDPVVARAASELQKRTADLRWTELSAGIVSSVRSATRRTWPLDAAYPTHGSARIGDTLRISDHVVKTVLHRALAGYHGAYLTRVELNIDEHRCAGAHLTVTGRYGDTLPVTGTLLADLAAETLADVLGTAITSRDITVHVDDLETPPLG